MPTASTITLRTSARSIDRAALREAALAIAFLTALTIVSAVFLVLYPAAPGLATWLHNGIGVATALAVIAGVRRHRPDHRGPWVLLALGMALFAAGDIAWTLLPPAGASPSPSVADIAHVTGYPLLMFAYLHVIAVRVGDGDRSGILDAAILATAVALVGWIVLLRPVLDAPGDPFMLAVSVGYPLGDLVIIGVAIGMLTTPGPRGVAFALLVLSLGTQFLGDLLYAGEVAAGTFAAGGLLQVASIASCALTGAAALHPSMRHVAMPHPVGIAWLSRIRIAFVTVAMLTGPALLLVHQERDVPLLVAGAGLLSVMVVWRLAIVVAALAQDNAVRRTLEDELSYRATHDPLTGLANRRQFVERLEAVLGEPASNPPCCVLFLDLDDFKEINDTLGHATGDALLVTVARRIRGHLRHGDLAARMGGDEFGILLRSDQEVACRVARRVLDSLSEPVTVGGQTLVARGSVGVAETHRGATVADLLADADVAMYRAKATGKGTVCVYAPQLRDDAVDRMSLAADLRRAIALDELHLEYQPIVDLRTGRPVAVEALVRWNHPVRGPLAPSAFIPLAEATGLGHALGTWVLDSACAQVAGWRRDVDPVLQLAVNLAPRQLAGPDLVALVYSAAERAGLPLGAVIVDVTEGALLVDAPEVSANLAALRALGARVAIDDFGTGYSSLGHLGRMPVDILKIDRAFVHHLTEGDERGIAAIVVSLGETLGLETIAEGIETREQLDALAALGCHLGQGYHLAPPASAEAIEMLLRSGCVAEGRPGPGRASRLPIALAGGA